MEHRPLPLHTSHYSTHSVLSDHNTLPSSSQVYFPKNDPKPFGTISNFSHQTDNPRSSLISSTEKVTFLKFVDRFLQASSIELIDFEVGNEAIFKKFAALIRKAGNNEEIFNKFDENRTGKVPFEEFSRGCKRMYLGMGKEDLEEVFKWVCGKKEKMFSYKDFIKAIGKARSKASSVYIIYLTF